jgi:hypothetical protein
LWQLDGLEKGRFRARVQRMEMHLTQADIERPREIVAARAPDIGDTGDLAERITLAVAIWIAQGRAQGIKEGIKRVTASNDR